MNDPRDDVKRWLQQESAAGRSRVWYDPDAVVSEPVRPEPARADSVEPRPSAPDAAPMVEVEPAEAAPSAAAPRTAAEKAAALAALDETQVSVCTKCALSKTRTNTVFGVGNPDAGVVFVGEAPGRDEDLQGEPFVGRAGQLLTKILAAIGFERDDVYICNVLKCRPPDNRDPAPDEVFHCEPYLRAQLDVIQPRVICALGRISAQTLLKTKTSLTKLRAQVHEYNGIPMVVTYHPAALLRNPNWKRPTWDDVQKLRAIYDGAPMKGFEPPA